MSREAKIDLYDLPAVQGDEPRLLYVQACPPELAIELTARGYKIVDLFSMPRGDPMDEVAYLMAKAQAIEEGTVEASRHQVEVLQMEMRAYGLLAQKGEGPRRSTKQHIQELDEILNWRKDRHTLRDNSTVQSAQGYNRTGAGQKRTAAGKRKKVT